MLSDNEEERHTDEVQQFSRTSISGINVNVCWASFDRDEPSINESFLFYFQFRPLLGKIALNGSLYYHFLSLRGNTAGNKFHATVSLPRNSEGLSPNSSTYFTSLLACLSFCCLSFSLSCSCALCMYFKECT